MPDASCEYPIPDTRQVPRGPGARCPTLVTLRERNDRRSRESHTRSMTTTRVLVLLLVVTAVTMVVARTWGGTPTEAGSQTYDVRGVVTAPPAEGRVMVAHEEIPGYMPAMTMPFAVAPEAVPAVRAGDRVRFTLRVSEDSARAEQFVVTGRDEAIAEALKVGTTSSAARLRPGDQVPSFSLVTESGGAFTAADLRGRVTAVTFIFTRCPVPEFCPLMVKRFQHLQKAVSADPSLSDVRLLSVTLDPAFDTPAVLTAYATAMRADAARWHFVTGDTDQIARLTKAFAIHSEKNGVFLDHTLATAVIDAEGRVVEIWRGNQWDADDVLMQIRDRTRAARR